MLRKYLEEDEEQNENIENINEEEIENVINTGGFNLSQESDSSDLFINPGNINSDTESELSDHNLQEENIMGATRAEVLRALESALGFTPNILDGAVLARVWNRLYFQKPNLKRVQPV
ncbi:unnamed protein product [Rhizophagus irregularis]|nr:unnamed protein product [Rhizophagus irregularis]